MEEFTYAELTTLNDHTDKLVLDRGKVLPWYSGWQTYHGKLLPW